jgi:UDP-N-acetyl-D-glucosamine dehydrogenase
MIVVADNVSKIACVVGLGYVGLPLSQLFIDKGYKTYGIDVNEDQVKKITDANMGFTQISTDFKTVHEADIIVVCVPTPVNMDKTPDLSIIDGCLRTIGSQLRANQLIIIESTVYPGYCNETAVKILEESSGLKVGRDIFLAHCPERINPGDKKWSVKNIPRVIGGFDETSLKMAVEHYNAILDAELHPMKSLIEAEAVKIVENTFRDVNIAFVNELAVSFSEIGVDTLNVLAGASTKPFGFMAHYPSIGVGGHCIPVDPYYLINSAKNRGYNHRFVALAREINEGMVGYIFDKVEYAALERNLSMDKLKLCVFGVAYKKNQSDTRESPGLKFIEYARKKSVEVKVHDPFVPEMSDFDTIEEGAAWADTIVVAAAHDAFREITTGFLSEHGVKVVADGQNVIKDSENSDVTYIGVGR